MKPRKTRTPFQYEEGKEKLLQHKLETYCAYTERCSADVARKLHEWKVPSELHDQLLQHLRDNRFLDDGRYASAFARGKFRLKGWGNNKIKAGLKAKSLDAASISEALGKVDDETYQQRLWQLMERKAASLKEDDPQQRRAKLFRYGVQKGYEPSLVLEWLERQT